MRRLGLLLLGLAACTPGTGETTEVDLGSSTTGEGTTQQGIQTVTSETMGSDPGTTDPVTTSGTTSGTTDPASGSSTSDPTDASSSTTDPPAVCGNGILEGDEACDDGNQDDTDECTNQCRPPGCGDGILQAPEECDDNNTADDDACTNACLNAFCGDGKTQIDAEECDDGNADDSDSCLATCKQARCGDGTLWAGEEICDDGFNDGEYNGCAADCKSKATEFCGDGVVQDAFEHCDGNSGMMGVDCTECLYDFSSVPQMSCAKTCSWAGAQGCGQEDADVFCKLRTGNYLSTAADFKLVNPTDKGGFPCSDPKVYFDPDLRKPLGLLTEFGVNKPVYYQESLIANTHGTAQVIQGTTLVCKQ